MNNQIENILLRSYEITNDIIYKEECDNVELSDLLHISQVSLHRIQEQISAAYLLYVNGKWAAFEAIIRLCIEYSFQLSYIMINDTANRFGEYFRTYFIEMKKRQKQYFDTFNEHELDEKQVLKSNKYLDLRESLIRDYLKNCKTEMPKDVKKKTFFEICEILGSQNIYRGVYSRLSSTVHADADSLIDYIITECIENLKDKKQHAYLEVKEWMDSYLLIAIEIYLDTSSDFFKCFNLTDRNNKLYAISEDFIKIRDKCVSNFKILGS